MSEQDVLNSILRKFTDVAGSVDYEVTAGEFSKFVVQMGGSVELTPHEFWALKEWYNQRKAAKV